MKKVLYIAFLLVFGTSLQAQNLAGVSFDAEMGVMDPSIPCMVDAGTQFGLDRWSGNNGGCPGDGFCQAFSNIDPMYNTYEFKNIVNLPVCITLDFTTGSCGTNTGGWIIEGTYVPSPAGSGTDPCTNNTLIQSSTFGGTISYGFEVEGCATWSANFHNGTAPSTMCSYSFVVQPDPLLDLRCADDPAACIEKVKIGGTPVPTMTQWGFFLFGLIVLTLGVVTLYNMTSAQLREEA